MYTGGGLAVTALAARSMFRAGLPLRLMTANPCEFLFLDARVYIITDVSCMVQGSSLVLVWWALLVLCSGPSTHPLITLSSNMGSGWFVALSSRFPRPRLRLCPSF